MEFEVQSKSHPYGVQIGQSLESVVQSAIGANVFVIADRHVAGLYPGAFANLKEGKSLWLIDANETQKSYEQLKPLFEGLIASGVRRNSTLLVVGGGVLQDIGCFVASVLYRGLRWKLVPTTLLAQCDSCIGSKSSLNIGSYKNQLGTFYPPHQVVLVFSALRTLSNDEIRSGLGEAIKLHLIAGPREFQMLRQRLGNFPADPSMLSDLILDSLRIKKAFIEKDEFDQNVRNILNYGHTFGHAYESVTQYKIPHGIAVTLGISTATYISERLGLVACGYTGLMGDFLRPFYDPYQRELAVMDLSRLGAALSRDKKNLGSGLVCVLTQGEGKMVKMTLDLDVEVMPAIKDWLQLIDQ